MQKQSQKLNAPVISRGEVVYRNPYQQVYRVTADFGDRTKEYFVTDTGARAGIVVVKKNTVLLVSQYRLLINALSWEIPGGKVDDGESPQSAAVRECLEESGVRCLDARPLLSYHAGLDSRHNPTHLFYAERIAEDLDLSRIHADEVSGSQWAPLAGCIDMISEGQILDSFTILALLAYQTLKKDSYLELPSANGAALAFGGPVETSVEASGRAERDA